MSFTWQPGRMGEKHAEPEARGFIDPRLIGTTPHSAKRERNVDSDRHLVGGFFALKFGPVKREDKQVLEAFSDISAQTLLNLGHVQVVSFFSLPTEIKPRSHESNFSATSSFLAPECRRRCST